MGSALSLQIIYMGFALHDGDYGVFGAVGAVLCWIETPLETRALVNHSLGSLHSDSAKDAEASSGVSKV